MTGLSSGKMFSFFNIFTIIIRFEPLKHNEKIMLDKYNGTILKIQIERYTAFFFILQKNIT